jgi:hypothetical protein
MPTTFAWVYRLFRKTAVEGRPPGSKMDEILEAAAYILGLIHFVMALAAFADAMAAKKHRWALVAMFVPFAWIVYFVRKRRDQRSSS